MSIEFVLQLWGMMQTAEKKQQQQQKTKQKNTHTKTANEAEEVVIEMINAIAKLDEDFRRVWMCITLLSIQTPFKSSSR